MIYMETMDTLQLSTRTQLPDALRVLLDEFPRASWEHDPGFEGLLRFWLDRHLMFRKILAQMTNETEQMLDNAIDQRAFTSQLARYGGMFVEQLHAHHTIEDTHYFPKLIDLDNRISAGFGILDKDHHAIDGHLNDFIEVANDVLNQRDTLSKLIPAAEALRKQLITLGTLLNRHLIDEEELVVPVVLKYGVSEL